MSINCQDEVREWQVLLEHVSRTIYKSGGDKCGRGPPQEWKLIAVKMCHAALEQLCTLTGRLSGADGGRCAVIPGTYWPANMVCKYCKPGYPVVYAPIIELPSDALSRPPRESIPYLWIFEVASEEEVGFQPGTSFHQRK